MGKAYYFGLGIREDRKKALDYFKLAAKQGHVEAQSFLSFCKVKENNIWHLAVQTKDPYLIKYIDLDTELKDNLNKPNKDGHSPLTWAILQKAQQDQEKNKVV